MTKKCRSLAATPVSLVNVAVKPGGTVGVGTGVHSSQGVGVGVGVGVQDSHGVGVGVDGGPGVGVGDGVHPMHGVGVGVVQGGFPETAAPMGTPDSVHPAQIKVAGGSLAYVTVTD